jgi:4-carboxymuconolactone decarboxylase
MIRYQPGTKFGLLLMAGVFVTGSTVKLAAQDRMPPIPPEKMDQVQKKVDAEFKELQKSDRMTPPWSVLLRDPDYVIPTLQMRLHNRDNSALSHKLTEFAILIAARQWSNNFEWTAHYPAAIRAGLNQTIATALIEGRRPENMDKDEEILYDFCGELFHNQSVSDATYARALAAFGEPGIVEAASLEGYYSFLAMVMNVARTPVSAGAKPVLVPFPRN